MAQSNPIRSAFNFLTSVKVAIPLLVLLAAASIVGSLIPQGRNVALASSVPQWLRRLNDYLQLNDIFHSWWYLSLSALLGLSLLVVTVKRVPTVWRERGRGPALGILLAHAGILLILTGMISGALFGFRYYVHLNEGEVAVLPPLPFVIRLDRLDVKYYAPEAFSHRGPNFSLAEKQESTLTFFHHGDPFLRTTAAPGDPVVARGITLLPAQKDFGWAFELVLEAGGTEKVVPVPPWAPPLITLGLGNQSRILAHRLTTNGPLGEESRDDSDSFSTEVFLLLDDGTSRSLGFAKRDEPVRYGAWNIWLGSIRRYTGLHIYSRPEKPFLVGGVITLIVGLIGYFTRWGRQLIPRAFAVSRLRVRRPAHVEAPALHDDAPSWLVEQRQP